MTQNHDNYPGFHKCLEMILTLDGGLAFEEGYGWLVGWSGGVPRVQGHVKELVAVMKSQTDPQLRSRMIELLGYTADEDVVPTLVAELAHSDRYVREWAVLSLEELGFPRAAEFAKQYKDSHPDEWGDEEPRPAR